MVCFWLFSVSLDSGFRKECKSAKEKLTKTMRSNSATISCKSCQFPTPLNYNTNRMFPMQCRPMIVRHSNLSLFAEFAASNDLFLCIFDCRKTRMRSTVHVENVINLIFRLSIGCLLGRPTCDRMWTAIECARNVHLTSSACSARECACVNFFFFVSMERKRFRDGRSWAVLYWNSMLKLSSSFAPPRCDLHMRFAPSRCRWNRFYV